MSKYQSRGVSAKKEDVHKAVAKLDKGIFSNSFCKVLPDILAGNDQYCNILHADTAGTKTSLAYMYWRETEDLNVWKGVVQDAIVMNTDDMACVGVIDNIVLSSTIGRNKHLIPGDILTKLIEGITEFIDNQKNNGIRIELAGGETADVGDIVRTIDVGFTAAARLRREEVISIDIGVGDVIVGMESFGQSSYESEYNSGIGSNGLTLARHDTLDKCYAKKYPESYDPNTNEKVIYTGKKQLADINMETGLSIGKLLLSPTRTYLPIIKEIVASYKDKINGLIHCTGGGQAKVLHFIEDIHVIKDNLFRVPPVFRIIQSESGTDWKEMYQVFNMGHRMEVYTDQSTAEKIIGISEKYDVRAQIIGRCEASETAQVTLNTEAGEFRYSN